MAYVVRVVLLQDPAPALVDILVALSATAHTECRVHVHVVTSQIEGDEALEDNAPSRESLRQEDEQTRGCAAPAPDTARAVGLRPRVRPMHCILLLAHTRSCREPSAGAVWQSQSPILERPGFKSLYKRKPNSLRRKYGPYTMISQTEATPLT